MHVGIERSIKVARLYRLVTLTWQTWPILSTRIHTDFPSRRARPGKAVSHFDRQPAPTAEERDSNEHSDRQVAHNPVGRGTHQTQPLAGNRSRRLMVQGSRTDAHGWGPV